MVDYGSTRDDWYDNVGDEVEPDVEKVASILEDEKKRSVLDVGCGAGRHMLYLAKQGFCVGGFDQSESAVEQVRESMQSLGLSANVVEHDMAERFQYEDESCDAVLAVRSIHHARMEMIHHAVSEMYRVLDTSGLLYTQVPTYEKLEKLQEDEEFNMVEPGTSIPLQGSEEGIPHHNFKRDEVKDVFGDFIIKRLYKQGDHYCLLARKFSM